MLHLPCRSSFLFFLVIAAGCGGSSSKPAALITPTITVSMAPSSVEPSQGATVTWSVTGALGCTASGPAFSGIIPSSGSMNVASPAKAGTYLYRVACIGTAGNTSAQATLTVAEAEGCVVAPSAVRHLGKRSPPHRLSAAAAFGGSHAH